jgi:hypothetical protein
MVAAVPRIAVDLRRSQVSGKQIAWTAGVALAVVVAFNHFAAGAGAAGKRTA